MSLVGMKLGGRRHALILTSVLKSSSNTFHGQDEGVFEPRCVVTSRVQLDEFVSRFGFHILLGDMWPQLHMVVWVADSLQRVCLAHVQRCDVGITQTKTLLQVQVSLEKILVSGNLSKRQKKIRSQNKLKFLRYQITIR